MTPSYASGFTSVYVLYRSLSLDNMVEMKGCIHFINYINHDSNYASHLHQIMTHSVFYPPLLPSYNEGLISTSEGGLKSIFIMNTVGVFHLKGHLSCLWTLNAAPSLTSPLKPSLKGMGWECLCELHVRSTFTYSTHNPSFVIWQGL